MVPLGRFTNKVTGIPVASCTESFGQDALAEFLNTVAGYMAKEVMPVGGEYQISPPDHSLEVRDLVETDLATTVMLMLTEIGSFVFIVAR